MTKRSKKYREAEEMVDRANLYTDEQAVALLKGRPKRGFDETVEATYVLNVDP
ncbi:MAG: 50S ribosomal protein L1, partial [Scardovia wiggsiae]